MGEAQEPIVVDRMQHRNVRIFFRGLAQTLRQQRLVLAQKTADHQHPIARVYRRDGHAKPGHAGGVAVTAKIALPQPEVDIVAAETAYQAAGQRQFLKRGVR